MLTDKMTPTVLAVVCFMTLATACQGQTVHPQKQKYMDAMDWPVLKPGDVELKNFSPFRAVYERSYTNAAGQPRQDRVIVSAELVGWDGHEAISMSLIDSGDPSFEDTNVRTLFMYFKRSDMSILFEVGPRPGAAKDYYVGRNLGDKLILNSVISDSDARDTQTMETDVPGFGPGTWVMANADLDSDAKMRLDPFYSPRANAVSGFTVFAMVTGTEELELPDGSTKTVHILEHASNPTSPSAIQRLVGDSPPYLFGSRRVNLDTGEQSVSMRLIEFDVFP